MANNILERLMIAVGADLSELGRELEKSVSVSKRAAAKISKDFADIGAGLQGMGRNLSFSVTAPILAIGTASLKAASDAEEMQSKFEAVFKDLSSETEAWAATTGDAVNRSRFDLMGYLATLQDTFVPLGFARTEAAEMSKQLTQLGVDLASFNNVAEDETISLLTSAIVGNHEAVRRFGIVITQATLDQELLNMGIMGGARAASEQEKAMARLNIIMGATSDAQGDAARTAGSFANQWKGLQSQMQEAAIIIGQVVLPVASQLVGILAELANWFVSLPDGMQESIVMFAAIAAAVGPVLVILGILASSLSSIIALAPGIVAAGRMIGLAISLAGGPITIAIAAIGALVAAYLLFSDEINAAVMKAYEAVDQYLGGKLTAVIEAAKIVFTALWEQIKLIFQLIGQVLTGDFSGALDTMKALFTNDISTLLQVAQTIFPGIVQSARQMYEGVKQWLVDRIKAVFDSLKNKIDEVKQWFGGLYDAVVGNSYIPDMVDEIGEHMARLGENMVDPARDAIGEVDSMFAGLSTSIADHLANAFRTGNIDFGAIGKDLLGRLGIGGDLGISTRTPPISGLSNGNGKAPAIDLNVMLQANASSDLVLRIVEQSTRVTERLIARSEARIKESIPGIVERYNTLGSV